MGYTNHTPNLELPQWVGSDKPQFLTDMNNAYSKIDASVTNIKNGQDTLETQFEQIKQDFTGIQTDVQDAQNTAQNAMVEAAGAKAIANNTVQIANDIVEWSETSLNNLKLITGDTGLDISACHMHYNENLKLLTVEAYLYIKSQEKTFTDLTVNQSYTSWIGNATKYFYPWIELPMEATIIQTIESDSTWNCSSNTGATIPATTVRELCLGVYNGKIYLGFGSGVSTGIPISTYKRIYLPNITYNLSGHFTDIKLLNWARVS